MMVVSDELWEALARGGTVLTGRAGAARAIRRAIDARSRSTGRKSWAPPRVFAWDSWTAGLWREMLLRGDVVELLLNRAQESALWRQIIESDGATVTLRDTASLSALAAEAWGELARYRGLRRLAGSVRNADMEAFGRWAAAFEAHCRERRYVAQAQLEDALRSAWRGHIERLPSEREIVLVGFERVLPTQERLLGDLQAAGCTVTGLVETAPAMERVLLRARDESAEIHAAAAWTKRALDQRPEAEIAILVPGLKGSPLLRARMDRVLREVLAPWAQADDAARLPYEFSSGEWLSGTRAGRAAISILTWARGPLTLQRVEELLLSEHFAGGSEHSDRAEFEEFDLRRNTILKPEMTLDGLVTRVEASRRRMPHLLACLRRTQAVIVRSTAGVKSYAEWSGVMRDLLGAAGWQKGEDDPAWVHQREMWEGALDEMATLDFAGSRPAYGVALDALGEIAGRTVFTAEARGAPVQVMGPEEACGLRFHSIVFVSAGELTWPSIVAGSPFLAWELRKDLGIPGVDGAVDLRHARRMADTLTRSCERIVFSYALRFGEQDRQSASPALSALGLQEMDAPEPETVGRLVQLEVVEDGTHVAPLPEGVTPGGAKVLKAQAACAFHAFAEYRLFATEREPREAGLNPGERGRAMHGMLEHFWAEVRTQDALKRMTTEERRVRLGRAIDTTFETMRIGAVGGWDAAYLGTQRDRLVRLGIAWLMLEQSRSLHFEVKQQESERELVIGSLRLNVRMDRIDETDEGFVLIDYKSGDVAPSAWLGERPDEPQLPLYAALEPEMKLHTVAFGLVKPGKTMKLTGYADQPGTVKLVDIPEGSLASQVLRWQEIVAALAEGFAHGDIRVSPKTYPGSCKNCAHRLICRLQAPSAMDEDGEDESVSEEDCD